jgi:hypothetical protein
VATEARAAAMAQKGCEGGSGFPAIAGDYLMDTD